MLLPLSLASQDCSHEQKKSCCSLSPIITESPTGPTGANFNATGFSAVGDTLPVTGSTQIAPWTTASPFYTDTGFDAVTGNYTVPSTGRYSISATINYSTTAAISVSIGTSNPSFIIRRTSPTQEDLITAVFPILNISVTLLTLRGVLGNGTVTIATDLELTQGDVIGLFYSDDGLSIGLDLGGEDPGGITWSVFRLS